MCVVGLFLFTRSGVVPVHLYVYDRDISKEHQPKGKKMFSINQEVRVITENLPYDVTLPQGEHEIRIIAISEDGEIDVEFIMLDEETGEPNGLTDVMFFFENEIEAV